MPIRKKSGNLFNDTCRFKTDNHILSFVLQAFGMIGWTGRKFFSSYVNVILKTNKKTNKT